MDIFSNILDPIQDTLDPDVFDNADALEPRVKATIASWVKNKVYSVLQANGYKDMEGWLRLILTGSLTTYQWAEDSDLDVSLWCSLDKFEEFDRASLIAIVLEQLDGHIVPGTTHPLQVFVIDVTKVKDFSESYQAGVRSAFDLDKMEWMVPPERARVHEVKKEFPNVFNSALQAASKMRSLLQYQPESARAYWKYLHKRRRSDMKAGRGDYADSNIIYKMLHNSGLFDTIQQQLGVHISRAILAESVMVDVEESGEKDPLADAATNTLVGPSITPKARPSGPVRKSHDTNEPHIHFEDLEDEFSDEPIIDVPDDIRGIENVPNAEDAEAKYDAFEHDDQNIPHPMTLEESKAHFKKQHGMDIDMFKQMMPDQFAQMTGGYDLAANPDIEEEIFRAMHGEMHNPNSPYSQMMSWKHAHPEGEQREASRLSNRVAQTQPLNSQMEWLDLVLEHGLGVDQIPADLHTHPTPVSEEQLPAHVLHGHGYLPNTDQLDAAHNALHDAHRMHWLYNNLSTPDDSN